jgi:hypothetical protein
MKEQALKQAENLLNDGEFITNCHGSLAGENMNRIVWFITVQHDTNESRCIQIETAAE